MLEARSKYFKAIGFKEDELQFSIAGFLFCFATHTPGDELKSSLQFEKKIPFIKTEVLPYELEQICEDYEGFMKLGEDCRKKMAKECEKNIPNSKKQI